MSDERYSQAIATIQACEDAIVRVRAAIRAGTPHEDAVGVDLEFIFEAVKGHLIRLAKRVTALGPGAFEEALEALKDMLLDDILSLSYRTLETQFGAYLKTRPLRVLQQITRKYGRTSVSFSVERLDHPAGPEGPLLGDTLADPRAEDEIDQIADADERAARLVQLDAAIEALPAQERSVVQWRRQGVSNNQIAERLEVSIATASRMYDRALKRLRELMATDGGEA